MSTLERRRAARPARVWRDTPIAKLERQLRDLRAQLMEAKVANAALRMQLDKLREERQPRAASPELIRLASKVLKKKTKRRLR